MIRAPSIALEALLGSLDGALLIGTPFISAFSGLKVDPYLVRRGDLFVALEPKDVALAIKNGAYGILFEHHMELIDHEIAWIEVPDVVHALGQLLLVPFFALSNTCVFAKPLSCKMLTSMTSNVDMRALKGELLEDAYELLSGRKNLVFVTSHEPYKAFFSPIFDLTHRDGLRFELLERSLCKTTFEALEAVWSCRLPAVFLQELLVVMRCAKSMGWSFDLEHLRMHYKMIFVSNSYEPLEEGKSDKVLFFEPFEAYLPLHLEHFGSFSWLSKALYLPKGTSVDLDFEGVVFYFEDLQDLIKILHQSDYNLNLLHLDVVHEHYLLRRQSVQPSLFDLSAK